jgi:hypothetical protein
VVVVKSEFKLDHYRFTALADSVLRNNRHSLSTVLNGLGEGEVVVFGALVF